MHGSTYIAATAAELARREPFRLGDTLIAPASREVRGPGGQAMIEPRVMQVLLALIDAAGAVVTRDDLIRICWRGQIVGEDAINRAVAGVRRVASVQAAGGFAVETITRTGYRLTGTVIATEDAAGAVAPRTPPGVPRRLLLGGAAAGLALAGAATYALWPDGNAQRAAELADQARLALNEDVPEGAAQGIALLRQALALQPRDAALWGRLALAWVSAAEGARSGDAAAAVQNCELAAARALALDPVQPDARTALIALRASYGDWLAVERKLRAVLADAPSNDAAAGELAATLQAVGRSREAGLLVDGLAARQPLSPLYQYRHVFLLWSQGWLGEADRTADRAFALWPRHPGVWSARLWLMGCTGRTGLALAQLDDVETRPVGMTAAAVDLLRTSFEAIQTRLPATVQAAVDACMAAAMTGPPISAIMVLSALGRLDEAFTVANGYMLRRGPSLMPLSPRPGQAGMTDERRRHSQLFFIPVTAPLRADPRFLALCRDCGLVDYWRQSGHWADFLGSRRIA